jgi:chloramphenicol 3-O phosphotransferase
MSKVIIINGPSCAGKTTIAKEICKKSNNKFVHLQIDKAGEFYNTIFPKGFKFAENEIGTENNDDGLKGLFNNNRLARRKVVASILLGTAKELLKQNFNIVIDTALDGPDAKELAQIYLEYLEECEVTFVGIYCPVDDRLKRLKTRKDNLFLTEDFIRNQTDQYDVFESSKEFYDVWFDSSLLNCEEIAERILEHNKNTQKDTVPKFAVRTSELTDISTMVLLSKAKRLAYEKAQATFWRYAGEEGDKAQEKWFKELLEDENHVMFTAESETQEILGFVIGKLIAAPEVYNPGGLTLMIDDFCVQSENLWQSVGYALIKEIQAAAKARRATQILVVCGAHDHPKRKFLSEQNLEIASEWFVRGIV